MTDNGSPYVSAIHAIACRALRIRHLRTRPRRPRTNGKAERFIRDLHLARTAENASVELDNQRLINSTLAQTIGALPLTSRGSRAATVES